MGLSRLILPKTSLHLHRRGIPKPKRWFSSSGNDKTPKFPGSKKLEAEKEQRAVAEKSYVKNWYQQPFSEATQVQNKVWGPWYTLKGILTKLRIKTLGNPQVQNRFLNETSDSPVDTRDSEVATTWHNNPHSSEPKGMVQSSEAVFNSHKSEKTISTRGTSHRMEENSSKGKINATASEVIEMHSYADDIVLGEPKSIGLASETIMDSLRDDKYIPTSVPSHMMGETSSEDVIGMTDSEVSKTHNNSDYTDLGGTESIVQSVEAIMNSQSNEDDISTSARSQLIGENSAEDMDQLKDISDSSKLVGPENEHGQLMEANSGLLGAFDRDQKTESEHLFCLTRQVLHEASTTLENDGANKLTSVGNEDNEPDKKITTFVRTSNARSGVGETSAPSGSTSKVKGLAGLFKKMNDQAPLEMVGKKNDNLTPNGVSECLNETSAEDLSKSFDVNRLINCIKELNREQPLNKSQQDIISNKTDLVSNRGSIRRILSLADVQKTDDKGRQTSLKEDSVSRKSKKFNDSEEEPSTKVPFRECTESIIEDMDRSDSDVAALDHISPQSSLQVLLPTSKEHPKKTPGTLFAKTGTNQNKVLLRFLNKDVENSDIAGALEDCGHIVKISKFSSIKGSNFKDAYVYFETRKGLEKALKKSDLRVKNAVAIVEATSSLEEIPDRISIPNLIGDPNAPVALMNNPTRTIMIKEFTRGISSCHLKAALFFCGSGITSFFLGSSSSVAYVEFETEDAKERAIEKHSIRVLGKKLLIFRIDAPRTTVVRISNINSQKTNKVSSILALYGKVKYLNQRKADKIDVHFKLAEWPNMLNILNSLNGMRVDGYQWHAQPAPVFPPEILRILWSQLDERRYVKAVIHDLLRKVEENPVDATGITHLAAKYYGEGF